MKLKRQWKFTTTSTADRSLGNDHFFIHTNKPYTVLLKHTRQEVEDSRLTLQNQKAKSCINVKHMENQKTAYNSSLQLRACSAQTFRGWLLAQSNGAILLVLHFNANMHIASSHGEEKMHFTWKYRTVNATKTKAEDVNKAIKLRAITQRRRRTVKHSAVGSISWIKAIVISLTVCNGHHIAD